MLANLLAIFNQKEFLQVTYLEVREYRALRNGITDARVRSKIRAAFDLTSQQFRDLLAH